MRWRTRGYLVTFALGLVVALLAGDTHGAERGHPFRIGALSQSWGPTPDVVGLRDGLLSLGYREDEDFVIGVRFTQGDRAALLAAAHQLLQHGVDLIYTHNGNTARAAQQATARIPVVFANVEDPVGAGLVQSFARPGGNITGVAGLDLELGPKRLEVFQELIPHLRRVLFLYDPADTDSVEAAQVYREAAHRLGIVLVAQPVRTEAEARLALAAIRQNEVDGLLAPRCCSLNLPGLALETASQQRIPIMFNSAAFWIEHGALTSYGLDAYALGRQAARLVDKILKGTPPAEIPVEAGAKIEFVINLQIAKALGLTIVPEMLYRADRLLR
jgi:putative ABC transport system substrate-binding protein